MMFIVLSRRSIAGLLALALSPIQVSAANSEPLAPEPVGVVEKLPSAYPSNWIMAQDSAFFHMLDGKVVIADALAPTTAAQFKGMMSASFIANYRYDSGRHRHYVAETFYSRGGRGGERTDVVTIWDGASLEVINEVILPAKRMTSIPKRIATAITNDRRYLLVNNFTPAQSVSVVDLEEERFVGEVDTAGCSFVIATGKRGFSSICSNGALLTVDLRRDGSPKSSERSDAWIDVDDDPVFEAMGMIDGVGYFPTFQGNVLPIDFRRSKPARGESWSLRDDEEDNWRPGGSMVVAAGAESYLYVLMHGHGAEGTHKDGGEEVWIYDVEKQIRVQRVVLDTWGISVSAAGDAQRPLMVVTNAEMGMDVYDPSSGELLNQLGVAVETPFLVHGTQ